MECNQKNWKKIFGRAGLVALAIGIQLMLVLALVLWLDEYYQSVQVAMYGMGFIVLITVINRDMTTEAKIPWVVLVLLSPLFGTVLYILFSGNRLTRRQKERLQALQHASRDYFHQDILSVEEFQEVSGKYAGQMAYIHRTTGQVAYQHTDVQYYPTGEAFFEDMLKELKKAEKYIFMEYFIIAGGWLWNRLLAVLEEKVKAGVKVRLIYDDVGSMGRVADNYEQILNEKGLSCIKFHPFKPVISEAHNNRDHRKITVIDGRVGFVGGANIADEYINLDRICGDWKDTGVKLTGPGVKGLTLLFLQIYNAYRSGPLEDFRKYLPEPEEKHLPANGMIMPFGDGPEPIHPGYIAENVYLNIMNQAERYLWITTPYLIIDSTLQNALCIAAQRGVDVRIVTPHIPDKRLILEITRSNYAKLQSSGVKIYEYTPGFIHAKQFLCDDEVAVIGSINLDYRSLIHHFECGVWIYGAACLKDMKADFEQIFAVSKNMENYQQGFFMQLLCRITHAFFPLL